MRTTEPIITTTTPAIIYGSRFIGMTSPPEELLPFVPVVEVKPEIVPLLPAETDELAEEDDAELDEE